MSLTPTSAAASGIPGFDYADLFSPTRLRDLFELWQQRLADADLALHARYVTWRAGARLAPAEHSQLLLDVAPHVSRFLGQLFGCTAEQEAMRARTEATRVVTRFKDEFVKRRALKRTVAAAEQPQAIARGRAVLERLGVAAMQHDDEERVARTVCHLLDHEAQLKKRPVDDPELVAARDDLAVLADWVVARRAALDGAWIAYHLPHPVDYANLVQLRRPDEKLPELMVGPEESRRDRDGFKLTDRRMDPLEVLAEVDYCIYCHERDKDSCSKGLRDAAGNAKPNPLGIPLEGCPLDEKISEMHLMKQRGDAVAALALVCVDNPMAAGTGHRICNDCMKSCIYQKQDPVNIPQIETAVLTDVLRMPYGFEIYDLLTRWNPLNARRPYPLPYHGKNVLVVGLGPAGYTLAHHLLNEGFGVVGIDGLKLEPAPVELVGDPARGILPHPIRDYASIEGELDERILAGFGGVSEYGITVRWDKNFLDVLRVVLGRRDKLRMFGGVRFGGTLTLEDAWRLGFDHVAIAAGAGKPTIVDLENNLIRGIRKASDFLMALQLTGAYKYSALANLQVRLPALVIGGGLTAIDTATELLAYYVVQVEKTLARYEKLRADGTDLLAGLAGEEREILEEQLAHGRAIREERQRAAAERRLPRFQPLLDRWGGCSIVYRKTLADSPAYRLNHEEVIKCLEEGVRFIEKMAPKAALRDEHGALRAVTFERQAVEGTRWRATGEIIEMHARTMCVAAGTSPNTIYEKERPGTFQLDKRGFFAPHRAELDASGGVRLVPDPDGFFTSYDQGGKTVSYYGDNHPRYAGSVVKAMASAKKGYVAVADLLFRGSEHDLHDEAHQATREAAWRVLADEMRESVTATVHEVIRLTPNIVEVVVRAPLAARKFRPGQFFRLQNYEVNSPVVDGARLAMEGIALTGAWTDPERGLLSLIILEMGGSSSLCAHLKKGEPVVVMGPTGAPTEIPRGETVVLAGGGLGNAVLFSIGRAMRAAGNRVVYFAGYKKPDDVYHRDDIEAGADQVVWSVDCGEPIAPRRAEDRAFVGNIVQAMHAFAQGQLGGEIAPFSSVDRIIAIGSDRMMAAVKRARHEVLAPFLRRDHVGIASINSPMQCMMKEVCAQCLQKHIDPVTKKETIVFSCFNQDQPIDAVDFDHLAARLRLNSVQEKLTAAYLRRLLALRSAEERKTLAL
jgi:NADPH-dependent glutamate synthase beta subunit-like oxidoreductase/NAD(P)H-flavin reductase